MIGVDGVAAVPTSTDVTLNFDPNTAKYTYPGGAEQTVQERLEQYVSLADFNPAADGVTDDSAVFIAAMRAAYAAKKPLYVNGGTYLITKPLIGGTNPESIGNEELRGFALHGAKSEKGANGEIYTRIAYEPEPAYVDEPMIWCWGSGGGNLGTFDIKNIYFNLTNSGASVLWFGNHTSNYLPISDNGVGGNFQQKAIQGVNIESCYFRLGATVRTEPVPGIHGAETAVSKQYVVRMAYCFDSMIHKCTFWENGRAITTLGCDYLTIKDNRIKGQIPINLDMSGTLTVLHVIDGLQVEGWLFGPILNYGVALAINNVRLESNIKPYNLEIEHTPGENLTGKYKGVYNLTDGYTGTYPPTSPGYDPAKDIDTDALGITANVTKDSDTITFSGSVTGILTPGYSLIELEDPANANNKVLTKSKLCPLMG